MPKTNRNCPFPDGYDTAGRVAIFCQVLPALLVRYTSRSLDGVLTRATHVDADGKLYCTGSPLVGWVPCCRHWPLMSVKRSIWSPPATVPLATRMCWSSATLLTPTELGTALPCTCHDVPPSCVT